MSTFQLTESAFRDIDSILAHLLDQDSVVYAYRLRQDLFDAFAKLALNPGLGHARPDLTSRPFVFFLVDSYLIVFDQKSDPLTIHAVLHGKRDAKRIFRARSR